MLLNLSFSFYLLFVLIFFQHSLQCQQSKLSRSVNYISEYIASNHFLSIKSNLGDLKAIDSIFIHSFNNSKNSYSETLLALTFATVPYRQVPIQIPLIKVILNYPLISADEKTFNLKNENLPRYIFFDSPTDIYGDKDKLAHFFGSAFLAYESNIFDLGELIGYFVEVFEESFKVQSEIDFRDIDVNFYGRLFGKLLKENKSILPSQIILLRSLKFFSIIL